MFLGVDRHGHVAVFASPPVDAAHSMDTDWYAVDQKGHVAHLASGETGSVPWDAFQQRWNELLLELEIARIERLVVATPGGTRRVLEPDLRERDPGAMPFLWDGVLQFRDREMLELFRAEYGHEGWRDLEGAPAVVVRDVLPVAFDEYWAAGAIVGAFVLGGWAWPRDLGLFEYSAGLGGPYVRVAVPAEPVRLEALPARLREELGLLRLPRIDFERAIEIDAERYARCRTWR